MGCQIKQFFAHFSQNIITQGVAIVQTVHNLSTGLAKSGLFAMMALINHMANIFKKKPNYKKQGKRPEFKKSAPPERYTSDKDLVDPILYLGDLDLTKYPILPPSKKEEQEFDVENPLNKR